MVVAGQSFKPDERTLSLFERRVPLPQNLSVIAAVFFGGVAYLASGSLSASFAVAGGAFSVAGDLVSSDWRAYLSGRDYREQLRYDLEHRWKYMLGENAACSFVFGALGCLI